MCLYKDYTFCAIFNRIAVFESQHKSCVQTLNTVVVLK